MSYRSVCDQKKEIGTHASGRYFKLLVGFIWPSRLDANKTSAASEFYTSWRQTNDKAKTAIKDLCSDSSKLWLRRSRHIIYTAGQQSGIISGMNRNSAAPSTILLFWESAWFSRVSVPIPAPHIYFIFIYWLNTLFFRHSVRHLCSLQHASQDIIHSPQSRKADNSAPKRTRRALVKSTHLSVVNNKLTFIFTLLIHM